MLEYERSIHTPVCVAAYEDQLRISIVSYWFEKLIFGGIDRGDYSKCTYKYIENRNRNAIHEIIKNNIRPGSTNCLKLRKPMVIKVEFQEYKVYHSKNLINPKDQSTHT